MDLHPSAVAERNYPGWLTCNVPLRPRLLLVAANQESFCRLSSAHQAVLEEAARAQPRTRFCCHHPSRSTCPRFAVWTRAHTIAHSSTRRWNPSTIRSDPQAQAKRHSPTSTASSIPT